MAEWDGDPPGKKKGEGGQKCKEWVREGREGDGEDEKRCIYSI